MKTVETKSESARDLGKLRQWHTGTRSPPPLYLGDGSQ